MIAWKHYLVAVSVCFIVCGDLNRSEPLPPSSALPSGNAVLLSAGSSSNKGGNRTDVLLDCWWKNWSTQRKSHKEKMRNPNTSFCEATPSCSPDK
ncbi:hypothetical protein ATANTOWER_026503, partial [Ataeniobius toweri]|nr:hypothetical protein [Ataeniobius toweri]